MNLEAREPESIRNLRQVAQEQALVQDPEVEASQALKADLAAVRDLVMEMTAREAVQVMIMVQAREAAREMKRVREAELVQALDKIQSLQRKTSRFRNHSNAHLIRLQKTASEHGTISLPESAAATQPPTTGNGFAQLNSQKRKQ